MSSTATNPGDTATLPTLHEPEPRQGQPTLATDVVQRAGVGLPTLDMDPEDDPNAHVGDATLDDISNLSKLKAESATRPEDGPSLDDKIRAHLDAAPRKEKKDPLLGEVLGGRFVVLKKIGAGGMGAVYRARQEGMDRDVAVKVLLGDLAENDTVLRRFTLEALAVSRLRHPNTIQIFDYGQTPQGNPYIAMELLEGLTLHDLLRQERPLPIRRALRVMQQVAASLSEAHEKGIVHRDLKPENIFLVPVGDNPDYVKVLDFGVAKLRDANDEKGTLTQAGSIFGTPRYMSPEQCSAQQVDGRSDLYSLGVMLYEMITGVAPFQSDQPLTLLLAHVNEAPPPPGSVTDKQVIPAEVEEFVLKLLAKLPEDRIQLAAELAKICHDLAETLPTAFDQRVGSAEAENLGVRLASAHTIAFPTARTMKVGAEQPTTALQVPDLTMQGRDHGGRRLLVPMAAIGLVGIAALGYALVAMQKPQETKVVEKQVFVDRQLPPLAADMVELTVTSVPPGAFVNRGTDNIGVTPLTVQRKKGAPAEQWQLVRDGYDSKTVDVGFETSRQVPVTLLRLAPVQAGTVAPPVEDKPSAMVKRPRVDGKAATVEPKPEVKPEPKAVEKVVEKAVEKPVEKVKPPEKKKEEVIDDLK
jgi:hypothetical protein